MQCRVRRTRARWRTRSEVFERQPDELWGTDSHLGALPAGNGIGCHAERARERRLSQSERPTLGTQLGRSHASVHYTPRMTGEPLHQKATNE